VNRFPTANSDGYSIRAGGTLVVAAPGVLLNDSDPDGDSLNSSLVQGSSHGVVTLLPDGSFEYRHTAAHTSPDSFVYEISDSRGGTARGQVNITITPSIPGDFDSNGAVDLTDINLLCGQIRSGSQDANYELTGDGQVDNADFQFLIRSILNTTVGDANLDGIFNSSDLILVFQAGEYEDTVAGNSMWADGDWNCDGEFSTADLIVAFQAGAYVSAAQRAARAIDSTGDRRAAVDHVFARIALRSFESMETSPSRRKPIARQ
jgi:hypothetical protein